jgi:hypothetical protein
MFELIGISKERVEREKRDSNRKLRMAIGEILKYCQSRFSMSSEATMEY